jgi:hypothetical protein
MKKILVVLLILSVAWGVFAQDGSWKLGGNVEIGTKLDFEPTPWDDDTENDKARAGGAAYNSWDTIRGRFMFYYTAFVGDGQATAGLLFNTRDGGGENVPFFSYNGENFNFSTALAGNELLVVKNSNNHFGYLRRLWGNYKFVNGLVFIEAAYKGEDQQFWVSDVTAGGGALTVQDDAAAGTDKVNHHAFFGKPKTFTSTGSGGANYLLADIRLEAINFGIMIPYLFGGDIGNGYYYSGYGSAPNPWGAKDNRLLSDSVLKQTIFGVRFSMAPVEFAAQFKVQHSGAYIGAKFFTGPVTVGAGFSGILSPEDIDGDGMKDVMKFFKFGGDLDFNGGVFSAGVSGSMERTSDSNNTSAYFQLIRVQPRFAYNIIPSHLGFTLDAGFYFATVTDGDVTEKDITWAVQPQLFWNFLGTGAQRSYGWAGPYPAYGGGANSQGHATGIIARYRIVSAGADWRPIGAYGGDYATISTVELGGWMAVNALDIIFTFHF